ncbi:MAG: hypothetical protein ABEJ70_04155 [Halobacteriaceae archaeon]
MTSLAEAYERQAGEAGRQRVYLGTGLFLAGAGLVVAGIVLGASPLLAGLGFGVYESRELAGVLAGLGVPAVFVGVFTVLPANRIQRAAAAVGAAVAVLGVMLFRFAYPEQWFAAGGVPSTLTLVVAGTYFLGTITTFWCLFTAVATFKTRNDPGGTVALEYTLGGETHTVQVAAEDAAAARDALGSVGVFGGVDDRTATDAGRPGGPGERFATSDGGADTETVSSPMDDAEVMADPGPESTDAGDRYCGNCAQFQYVRTEDGIEPYCGLHDEVMVDMDACSEWTPNRGN